MKRSVIFSVVVGFLFFPGIVFANTSPVVSNVTANQRTDGSGIVDIYYTLSDADNDRCTVSIEVSDDGGSSWNVSVSPSALSGDLTNVYPGNRHITWNSKTDLPGVFASNYRIKVTADDGAGAGMVWVYINDPGFTGYMSKYETTNAQFCEFLNAAKASGDITVDGSYVKGASGPYSGQNYYNLAGAGYTYNGATNGGAARINWTGSSFTVDSGFDDHPVTYVSWYGSTAFCNYNGWRLLTGGEWQAVADYDGSYTYGCGTTINNSIANYNGSAHPNGTTVVGRFGTYGYGICDMAGNVCEWTTTCYYDCGGRYNLGGGWEDYAHLCTVSSHYIDQVELMYYSVGFRVCR